MENVITLSKLIDLLLFCPHTSLFCFSKNTRNELARPVMGTIFVVMLSVCLVCQINCVGGIT